jgi:hypothetical protein
MTGIPDLDLRKIQRYATRVVPPNIQDRMRMEVDVRGKTVTIVECRPPWREDFGPEWTRKGIARMKFNSANNEWALYWSDRNSRWHLFDILPPGSVDEVIDEIERDRTNIFWG